MNQHPHLKTLHTLYAEEAQPFRKVHRMIDLFESVIKSHTVVIIAEYVQHNQLSDTAKGLLAQGLRTPSLGTWQLFSRVLFEELQAVNYAWTLSEFALGFEFLDKSLNSDKTNVIAFRNGYAHGATPSDEQCENDIRKFEPYLDKLLSLRWIEQSSIEVNEGIVYVQSEVNSLCCHPIFLFRDEDNEASFAFFNDLKNDKIGLLNYPLGKHYREKEFFKVFHEYLPLNEWKKSGNNEFYQRIEELTETFKGRTFEREKLLQFVINETKGYCSIQGNPGIGKSALIAQFFKDLRASEKAKNVNVVEYFIRRGTAQAQTEYLLNYLIKRTDELFPQGKEVRAEGKMVFEIQQQLFNKWRLWAEHSNGKKLLFLIDGLDEGVENNIVSYLPRENFQDILIIYGSRPGGHKTIDELWATLPLESHSKIELSGLSKEDIRALIYEVANKYDLEKDSEWIEAVQKRSQGNPLYLKLLCDSIENGGIALNDVNALPSKIDEYYKAILLRYAQDPDGVALLAGLYTFAAAKDYLTMSHLGLMNQLGDATLERIGSTLKEVLYENPLTEDVLDYQLFHESFREYLVKEKTLKVNEAKQRIIEFCGRWKELEGQWEQRYVLEHYASHLHESIKEQHSDLLLKLIYDTDFQSTQKKVLRGFESTNTLFRLALLKASDIKRFDEQLEAGLCLVDLKYEEANDAPQIVAMVANGEIDLALKRIESFGGSDKEGIQRKFILYMLCLMELTLLESKDKPFRKDAIQRLLNHLDEQIPTDTTLMDWRNFFPSILIFTMAFECAELGLNYLIIFHRTDSFEIGWLKDKSDINDFQLEVIKESCNLMTQLYPQVAVLSVLGSALYKMNKLDRAEAIMTESLEIASNISSKILRDLAYESISIEYSFQGKYTEAIEIAERNIQNKNDTILKFSFEFASQSQFDEIMKLAEKITDEVERVSAMVFISSQLFKFKQFTKADELLDRSIDLTLSISDQMSKNRALREIAIICAEQRRNDKALFYARQIDDMSNRCYALSTISKHFSEQGESNRSDLIMLESKECYHLISDSFLINSAFFSILNSLSEQRKFVHASLICFETLKVKSGSIVETDLSRKLASYCQELAQKDLLEKSIILARTIPDKDILVLTLCRISSYFNNGESYERYSSLIQELIDLALSIEENWLRNNALVSITEELARQGQMKRSIILAKSIESANYRCLAIGKISTALFHKKRYASSLALGTEAMDDIVKMDDFDRINTLSNLSLEFYYQKKIELADQLINDALVCCNAVEDDLFRDMLLVGVYSKMVMQGRFFSVLNLVENMSGPFKSAVIEEILSIYAKSIPFNEIDYNSLDNYKIKARHIFWRKIGESMNNEEGLVSSLDRIFLLENDEAKLFYLRGVSDTLKLTEVDIPSIQKVLPYFINDSIILENLLQVYVLRNLFMTDTDYEFLVRANRTLNIQWAIDIAAKFPKERGSERISTNLETWLHEIADEDDRDQIELWAKQVAKGKITEEEFGERVKELM